MVKKTDLSCSGGSKKTDQDWKLVLGGQVVRVQSGDRHKMPQKYLLWEKNAYIDLKLVVTFTILLSHIETFTSFVFFHCRWAKVTFQSCLPAGKSQCAFSMGFGV